MSPWPPHVYRRQGLAKGVSPALIDTALAQAHSLQNKNYPAILTLNHLAARTEVSFEYLRDVVSRRIDAYRVFNLRKQSTGYREICIPAAPLLWVQQWIHSNILVRTKQHPASFAYAPGSSTRDCARIHCGARWMIKLDIQSFFESISEIQVYNVFHSIGYGPLVAFELSRLCTRRSSSGLERYKARNWRSHGHGRYIGKGRYSINTYRRVLMGHLPQGAPTSPILSNLAVVDLDEKLRRLAAREGMSYSRYSDDLVFSTARDDFSRKIAASIIGEVYRELSRRGFDPNRNKAVVSPPGARKIVLGLVVDGDSPRLPKEFKERLRQHLYYLNKYGVANHAQKQGFKSLFSMKRHIEGLAFYALHIEKSFGEEVLNRLAAIDWPPLASSS
ncbi:reverse transcriptase family protein [Archangium violaceum]|uniref:reverse transcriptase family protein n=1 Tax=Archangium violaceum TaxID=83451 RepID=UPI0031B806BF